MQWDEALDIALSAKDSLQASLSSYKHSTKSNVSSSVLTIRDLLQGSSGPKSTLCIHKCSNLFAVEALWHRACNVYTRDILLELRHSAQSYLLLLSPVKMGLYFLSTKEVAASLGSNVSSYNESRAEISMSNVPGNLMLQCVRQGRVDMNKDAWRVSGLAGTITTMIDAEVYREAQKMCDVCLSSDISVVVDHIGKAKAAMLYRAYIHDSNVDLYLSKMLTRDRGIETYKTMCSKDIVKKLCIRGQATTMTDAALHEEVDELSSLESRLMIASPIASGKTRESQELAQ